MIHDVEKARLLLARVRESDSYDTQLNADLFDWSGTVKEHHCLRWRRMEGRKDVSRNDYLRAWSPDFCKSVDAAIKLAEHKLPGSGMLFGKGRTRPEEPLFGCVIRATVELGSAEIGAGEHPKSLSLAIVAATLSAIISQSDPS